ncbi:MAG: septum formation inhibitor Maf [Bacteroidota bacterium]
MKFATSLFLTITLVASIVTSCTVRSESGSTPAETEQATPPTFNEYWYAGKAEISSYRLEQARYGGIHEGNAVLIFVTEDFSKSKQVKLDRPKMAGEDRAPILKMNQTKKFLTGIYPYSLMTSVFTPVKASQAPLKVSTTSQEWCGHTFMQVNKAETGYDVRQFSYFESEGDQSFNLPEAILEDNLWNQIRLAPEKLPTGKLTIIPGTFHARLKHRDFRALAAIATLTEEGSTSTYSLEYPTENRSLNITFNAVFPHEIQSWEETIVSGWGPGAKKLTTKATLMKRIQTAYWSQNGVGDRKIRGQLDLPF